VVMALLGASWVSMWFFLNLYLQQILHFDPMESGFALLPMTGLIMVMMLWMMPKLIGKLGTRKNMMAGLGLLAVGLTLFSLTPTANGNEDSNAVFMVYVVPASIVSALGMSLSYIPILTSAMSNAREGDMGIASGLVNTTYQIGSALGLAIMVSVSTLHSESLARMGTSLLDAINNGFHMAFIGGAIVSVVASIVALIYIKTK
ncbi:MAG: MFS transporter, partial [Thermoproteota archaeon]|nr:MFS transporter [Thermoproteota archaeon]